jgi:hypothetical protein
VAPCAAMARYFVNPLSDGEPVSVAMVGHLSNLLNLITTM